MAISAFAPIAALSLPTPPSGGVSSGESSPDEPPSEGGDTRANVVFSRRWTLQQQLTILNVLFLCLGGAALWLLAELFQSREGAITARTQGELARADARLIKEFWEANLRQSQIPSVQWDEQWKLSTKALAEFERVEGGFYLLQADQLGYAYPTHKEPIPKRDIPPMDRRTILELVRRATSQGLPQEQILHPGFDIVVLRADPLPLEGAVWTMKRIHKPQDAPPTPDYPGNFDGFDCGGVDCLYCTATPWRRAAIATRN